MAKLQWYHKIGRFFKALSGGWIIIPMVFSIFNALTLKSYEIESRIIDGKNIDIVIGEHFDFSSVRAIGNYLLFFLFFFLFLLQKYFKDKEIHSENTRMRETLDGLCEELTSLLNIDDTYRVSIFKMKNNHLEIVGRFSAYVCRPDTQVKFEPTMGSVGIAYHTGRMHKIDDLPDFETSSEEYYAIMEKKGNMAREDVDKLDRKHRSYLSVPIKYHRSRRVCAVLVIDCSVPAVFSKNQALVEKVSDILSQPLVTLIFPRTLRKEMG